jgi:2-(1,2-epoxy-1,2-dihydrophenyl)acetyl-CoA isomerase
MSDLIRVDRHETFRVVTLNRPDRMNALTAELIGEVVAALSDAESDPTCRALVLTGSGRAFCAGADLAGIDPSADLGETLDRGWNVLARKIHALAMPSIAAVNGFAAGAGANIALGCDIVLAGKSASFIQAFSKIGLVPDAGGTYHLPRLVGEARARALAMLAEPVTAERAEAIGMIYKSVDDADLMPQALALATRLASLPTQALLATRRLLAASNVNTFNAQLDLERDTQRTAGQSPDFQEGVEAFLEKRSPIFNKPIKSQGG